MDPRLKVHVALETVTVSFEKPSATVTVTSLSDDSAWLLVSVTHEEQKSLTSICAEYTIVNESPCSIVPEVPPDLLVSVTLEIVGCAASTSESGCVSVPPAASVTMRLTLYVPALAVGVPEITPVLELIDRPEGRPVADQVYGVVPAEAAAAADVYGADFSPLANDAVVTFGKLLIVIETLCVSVAPDASVTVALNDDVAAVVGVPDTTPLELIANPAGRPVPDHVYGAVPPEPATLLLYATVRSPAGIVAVVMFGAALTLSVYQPVYGSSPSMSVSVTVP